MWRTWHSPVLTVTLLNAIQKRFVATAAATWAVSWSNTKIGTAAQNAHSAQMNTATTYSAVVVIVRCDAPLVRAAHRGKSE